MQTVSMKRMRNEKMYYLLMRVSSSWALEPQRGDRGFVLSGDVGGPSISHWSLRDFLCDRNMKKNERVRTNKWSLMTNKIEAHFKFVLLYFILAIHSFRSWDANTRHLPSESSWRRCSPNPATIPHVISQEKITLLCCIVLWVNNRSYTGVIRVSWCSDVVFYIHTLQLEFRAF